MNSTESVLEGYVEVGKSNPLKPLGNKNRGSFEDLCSRIRPGFEQPLTYPQGWNNRQLKRNWPFCLDEASINFSEGS